MEFRIEGGVERAWKFGKRRLALKASLPLPNASGMAADFSDGRALAIWAELYEAFTAVISPSLALGEELLHEDHFHLLAVLSGAQGKTDSSKLRLRNARGQIDANQKIPQEILLFIAGMLEFGDSDPEDEESGPRREEYWLKVESHFETFRNGGGIEYGLEYKPQIPGELRGQGTSFLKDPQFKNQVKEFRFSWDRFASTSFGMSLGLVPRVLQSTEWYYRSGVIGLVFSRELASGERASALGGIADIVQFGRAMEALSLCNDFTGRCTDYLESKLGI